MIVKYYGFNHKHLDAPAINVLTRHCAEDLCVTTGTNESIWLVPRTYDEHGWDVTSYPSRKAVQTW